MPDWRDALRCTRVQRTVAGSRRCTLQVSQPPDSHRESKRGSRSVRRLSVSVSAARVQFPDPHFKNKHKKRRVVQPGLVRALAANMQSGGAACLVLRLHVCFSARSSRLPMCKARVPCAREHPWVAVVSWARQGRVCRSGGAGCACMTFL